MSAYGLRGSILVRLERRPVRRSGRKIRTEEAGGYFLAIRDSAIQGEANKRKPPAAEPTKAQPKGQSEETRALIYPPNNTALDGMATDGKASQKAKPSYPPRQHKLIWKPQARAAGPIPIESEQRNSPMDRGTLRKFFRREGFRPTGSHRISRETRGATTRLSAFTTQRATACPAASRKISL